MKQTTIVLALLLLFTGAGAKNQGSEASAKPAGDVSRWVERFEPEDRVSWQKPPALLRLLALEEGDEVADLGTGTGFLLRWLSPMVGASGKVYAIDIDRDMLAHVEQRTDISIDNVETILAEENDPRLPQGRLAAVLIVNTWHHIKNRGKYIPKLAGGLRPDGRVVIVDFHEGDLPVGPQEKKHKVSRDQVVAEFEKAGWRFTGESMAFPYQYYLTFIPPGTDRRLGE